MARPIKHNADYFPHNCDLRNDRRCRALRSKYDLEGYAIFIMLLEILTNANHFQIENNTMEIELVAGDMDVDANKLQAILDYLLQLGLVVSENGFISSPILSDLKILLQELRNKDRKRKNADNGVFHTENPKGNEVIHAENILSKEVFPMENTQSKVKESKGNKSKEEEIKEKGNTTNQSPLFFNSENSKEEIFSATKIIFEKYAPNYVWENKDCAQLFPLLQKICITKPDLKTAEQLAEAFDSFLQKLPEYWRSKKFTIPNLNFHYNEIVTEIRAKQNSAKGKTSFVKPILVAQTSVIKREPTPEEKTNLRKDFIKSICESYEKYVASGQHGYLPLWTMHDTLVEEKVLKLPAKKLEQYRNQALAARKAELQKPKHAHEVKAFHAMLENFDEEMQRGTEKHRIDNAVKSLAVQGLFEELKKKKTDLKIVFKK